MQSWLLKDCKYRSNPSPKREWRNREPTCQADKLHPVNGPGRNQTTPPTKRQTECVRNLVKEWCNSCPQGKPHRDYQSSITCERKERCADHAYSSITLCILMKDVVQREEKTFWALILLLQIIAHIQIERLMQEKDMKFQKQEKHKEVLTSCSLVSDHELFPGLRSRTFSGFRSQTFFWFQIMGLSQQWHYNMKSKHMSP